MILSRYNLPKALTGFLATVLMLCFSTNLWADDHDSKIRYHILGKTYFDASDADMDRVRSIPPVTDNLYKKECGNCHLAFQPGLLPVKSWEKIMSGLKDHFGDEVVLTDENSTKIKNYLVNNAAEKTNSKRAKKMLEGLGSEWPKRISQVPYLVRQHQVLPESIFKRRSVKSISHCEVCHTTADRGIYTERYIHIPQ